MCKEQTQAIQAIGVSKLRIRRKVQEMRDATIVFDLDGTLVDTAPDLIDATNFALAGLRLPAVTGGQLRDWISFGARRMLAEALAIHGRDLPEAEVDNLLGIFLDYYAGNIANRSRPYKGVLQALDELQERGARLAICTNKREELTLRLLDALGLTSRFAGIAGRDTFAVCKPHPDHLLGAIRLAAGQPERAIMIGDSATDVATAKAAGIPVIAVSFGYSDIPAAELGADRVIDCHSQLITTIGQLL